MGGDACRQGRKGIAVAARKFGFTVVWSDIFRDRFEGQPLKGVALNLVHTASAAKPSSPALASKVARSMRCRPSCARRSARSGRATLHIALRPNLDMKDLIAKISGPKGKQSLSNFLRKAVSLSPVAIGLLQEAAKASGASLASMSSVDFASLIQAVPMELDGVAPMSRAISTAGGIAFDELDDDFMLRRLPGVFAAGEMLDWEAPTGGYLLQASFATSAAAGEVR